MATRWSVLLMAGFAGCAMRHGGYAPAPRSVVHVDSGPRLMLVVGTDLRYCDECDDDVFFYSESWWAYRSGGWYRSRSWGEPWIVVEAGRLPVQFLQVPPNRFKHRFSPRHPAHEHHPAQDRWSAEESAVPGPGGHATPDDSERDKAQVKHADNEDEKDKDKEKEQDKEKKNKEKGKSKSGKRGSPVR